MKICILNHFVSDSNESYQKNDLEIKLAVSKGFLFCLILVNVESIFMIEII